MNVNKNIIFYDDRNKDDATLVSTKIIFADDDLCICEAMAISEDNEILSLNEKIVFNLKTREVYNPEYQFWYAQNIN